MARYRLPGRFRLEQLIGSKGGDKDGKNAEKKFKLAG